MRNLKLISEAFVQPGISSGTPVTCTSIDSERRMCYVATGTELSAFSMLSGKIQVFIDLAATGLLATGSSVIAMHCQADADSADAETASVVAAMSSGDLLVWHTSSGQSECVGSVESGLRAMSWSPDGEMLVLYTGADTIILMTKDFDPVVEVEFHQQQFGAAELVTVGWGKKETQFHGSDGKAAALRKSEAIKELATWDDRQPRVRWRGDGLYFVVSAIDIVEGTRKLRVWSREGLLHSTSQVQDGFIEQALDWKPSGSLIVSSQSRPQRHDIVFFERNGLRHGEFTLPFPPKQVQVKEALWNSDSTVLLVWCEELSEAKKSHIQLWTMGNYHWYLKQAISTAASDTATIVSVTWDDTAALRLHVMKSNGLYAQYNWSWTTSAANSAAVDVHGDDDSVVAVIDGGKLLVTPFLQMVVPPPMCAYSLQMDSTPSCVAVAPYVADSSRCLAAASGHVLFVFGYNFKGDTSRLKLEAAGGKGFQAQCRTPCLKATCGLESVVTAAQAASVVSVRHLTWLSNSHLAFVMLDCDATTPCASNDYLYIATIDDCKSKPVSEMGAAVIEQQIDIGGTVLCVAPILQSANSDDWHSSKLAIELLDGTMHSWTKEAGMTKWLTATSARPLKFPVPCPEVAVCTLGGQQVVCGLSETYRFFIDDVEVASDCTSFALHNDFLLLTTYSHTLRCIRRDHPSHAVPPAIDNRSWPLDETIRRIERGSRIVVVIPNSTKVVLQMPRGNLEAVHPRALVLSTVRRELDLLHFQEAFSIVRRHRISMNIIYDHNPEVFLTNVTTFVQQIGQVQLLNEFISDLQDENVCSTMYAAYYCQDVSSLSEQTPVAKGLQAAASQHKIDIVCDSLLGALKALDSEKYTLAILTAYAKKTMPQLEEALFMIKTLQGRQMAAVTAEEALKYLLFLVDVHRLYDVALGTYDFDLALMVAERSQMDPKEYLPFLNEVRLLETNYQRFKIDQHLKRFAKALSHIAKCGSPRFSECLQFTDEHRLYSTAMTLYAPSSEEYKQVVSRFADHLIAVKRHEEAGLLCMQVSQHQRALECFAECGLWQHFIAAYHLASTTAAPEGAAEFVVQCRSMAEDLRRKKIYLGASRMFELYVKDEEEAVACLVEGCLWEEALRIIHSHRRPDLDTTHLQPAIVAAAKDTLALLQSNIETFTGHARRLQSARQEKAAARNVFYAAETPVDAGDDELFSDAGSSVVSRVTLMSRTTTSAHSKSTGRSSKNRRKADRKKWSLKEGSPYEELALMESLKHLAEQTDACAADIGRLLRALVLHGHMIEAADLQQTYERALNVIEANIPKIWTPDTWPCGHVGAAAHQWNTALAGVHMSEGFPEQQRTAVRPNDQAAIAPTFSSEQLICVPPVLSQKKTWALSLLQL